MTELNLFKGQGHTLVAANDESDEYIRTLKAGQMIRAEFRRVRNPKFHRKFFALLDLGFDHFEPQPFRLAGTGQVITPGKDRDEFRRWVTVLAGYQEVIGYPDGSVRLRAKSIKFSQMDQAEFEGLYSAAVDVLLQKVLQPVSDQWTREELERVMERITGLI